MSASTVTSKGQITIPKEVRDALGLDSGHRVLFEDGVVEIYAENPDLLSFCGIFKPAARGVKLADMEEAVCEGAAGQA